MKLVLAAVVLLASVGAVADQELRVVARDYAIDVQCELAVINDGYKEPVMVEYTVCKGQKEEIEKLSSGYRVVLKVEGLNYFSKEVLAKGKVQGDLAIVKLNVRITGVTE